MSALIPKIVIDTNIYISAIFWGGKPREIVELGRSGYILVFSSAEIAKEIDKKLRLKINYPAASCGVSKTARNEASFGEYDPERFKDRTPPELNPIYSICNAI